MIGSLRGTVIDRGRLVDKGAGIEVLVEVAGVGYRVVVTAATLGRLPSDEPARLFIHHHIREADQRLYGFGSIDERNAFEGLLSAHGVGPALALAVMATYPVSELATILANDDLTALCQVPGVGRKTAQRLLVELKATVVLPVLDGPDGGPGPLPANDGRGGALGDVREALVNLGYSSEEIRRAVAEVSAEAGADGVDSGRLLKQALLVLAG